MGDIFLFTILCNIDPGMSLFNPRKNLTKTPSGAELRRVLWSHFPSGFCQTAIYDQE